ncbi:pilus assembly protein PilX [Psychrobacter sp. AOP7-D1-15]|uniref:pilus assembly protein PilX n=1 Tax=unclassified Psychrobacter TaxID=196806 RepID=UPI001866DB3F|nr:pilus assembly protein PilX [Psychrobacter sp. FME61]
MSNMQQYPSLKVSPSSQQGAVLIVVLLFLVLIILAGVIAVKQSTTDLRLATSDQINTLLLQSADNANQSIEQSVNGSSDEDIYDDMLSITGPFGYFMLNPDNSDHEYVFCFRPRDRFFDINRTSVLASSGTILGSNNGYCNPEEPEDYVSSRKASMTQVNISLTSASADTEAFSNYTIGQDSSSVSSQAYTFDINNTAVLPAYADTEVDRKNCFAQTSRVDTVADSEYTIGGCMASAGVPSAVIYEQANVENQSQRTKCVEFGTGGGLLCTLPSS